MPSVKLTLAKSLSKQKTKELERLRDQRQDLARRVDVIILMDRNRLTIQEIAHAFGISEPTIRTWVRRFNALGVEGLIPKQVGRPKRKGAADG